MYWGFLCKAAFALGMQGGYAADSMRKIGESERNFNGFLQKGRVIDGLSGNLAAISG